MLYKKLFFTYSVVVICLIGAFDFYLVSSVQSNNKSYRLSLGEKLAQDISGLLGEIENSNKFVVSSMYHDYMLTNDIINFLIKPTNEYLKAKLDNFSDSNQYTYGGVERFVSSSFISNDKIENIIFVSKALNEVRSFNKLNQIYSEEINVYEERIKDLSPLFFSDGKLFYVNDINNPNTLEEEGKLIVGYRLDQINHILSNYGLRYKALILDENQETLYVPEDLKTQTELEDIEQLMKLNEREEYAVSQDVVVSKLELSKGLSVISEVSMKNLIESPSIFYSSIILLDLILILVALSILRIRLEKLTRRTDQILEVMEEVKEGNLKIKIPIDKEADEISYISEHFNQMCSDLDKYINKSYLAEINQKKAEMIALQNQINPHFLYNTLECIRMKAICNGDKDVGKMLYNLSYLFRKQVKDKNIITLKSELDYCATYMEIFKFRYHEKFNFTIDCKEEFYENEMIKFTLQPLVENYFVHGIMLEKEENFIEIKVTKEANTLHIIIDDNGRGIPVEKLDELNQNIVKGLDETIADQSIGIINAHERIVSAYGEGYGITLDNNSKGARVKVIIPCKRGNEE